MKRMLLFCMLGWAAAGSLLAQTGVTQWGRPTGQPAFPLDSYQELPDPAAALPDDGWAAVSTPRVAWGSIDCQYPKHAIPREGLQRSVTLRGWRGERVHAQALVWTGRDVGQLRVELSGLEGKGGRSIPASECRASFVRYVLTDRVELTGHGGCNIRRDGKGYDSLMVADVIDHRLEGTQLPARTVQPVWVQVRIPAGAVAGTYCGELTVKDGDRTLGCLPLTLEVNHRRLPEPAQWNFHLDLWQNPFAVARYYKVPLWSEAHFEAMRPLMKMLAEAGQKVITASIVHKPWNAQTEDYFESMVTWMRRADGTWTFDYTVFDRWVEFMMSLGIDRQINCYSMVPWRLTFSYYDQATNAMQTVQTAPGEEAYAELWTAMLTSFAKHLKEKGWFERCTIAMDERPLDVMQKTLAVIRKADPDFKVSLAGNYHPEIEKELHDYCITLGEEFPAEVLRRRAAEGKKSTCYTCCAEPFPNLFTFSPLAESAGFGFYAARKGLDGYLRWAYNSWPLEPLLDSRFRLLAGGDTHLVYPGGRSSLRMERLVEGIQAYEKVCMLRDELQAKGDAKGLARIEAMLATFRWEALPETPAAETVGQAQQLINSF